MMQQTEKLSLSARLPIYLVVLASATMMGCSEGRGADSQGTSRKVDGALSNEQVPRHGGAEIAMPEQVASLKELVDLWHYIDRHGKANNSQSLRGRVKSLLLRTRGVWFGDVAIAYCSPSIGGDASEVLSLWQADKVLSDIPQLRLTIPELVLAMSADIPEDAEGRLALLREDQHMIIAWRVYDLLSLRGEPIRDRAITDRIVGWSASGTIDLGGSVRYHIASLAMRRLGLRCLIQGGGSPGEVARLMETLNSAREDPMLRTFNVR